MKPIAVASAIVLFFGAVTLIGTLYLRPARQVSRTADAPSPQRHSGGERRISGIVVPHHNLVKGEREALFKEIKSVVRPRTVILVSPNHYISGRGRVQTTKRDWEITEGVIRANKSVIDQLTDSKLVTDEAKSFIDEHGISLILRDIKSNLPQAEIVPLIIKLGTTNEEIMAVHRLLEASCADCLMIASVDFSHYQPALLADLHDDLTLRALQELNAPLLLTKSETDSPPTLALLVEWAKSHDTKQFVLNDRTNSGTMMKDPDIETTTHLFGWYEKGEQTKAEDSVSFIVGGDMMFGRLIAHKFLDQGLSTIFERLGDRVFWGTDASIINLEGPVSELPVPDDTRPDNLSFHFPPETIKALQNLKIYVASLANNHTADRGSQALDTTSRLLREGGIQPLGGPRERDAIQVATIEGKRLKLVIIGVNAVSARPDILPLIKQLNESAENRILVFPHWGSEYVYKHGPAQERMARDWIDAGADIVVGAHPHVIQDAELYKGKPIIYSIGNFVFDQTFSSETQVGLFIAGRFNADGLKLFALPHRSTQFKPALLRGEEKKSILSKLYLPFLENVSKTDAGEMLVFPREMVK